MVAGAHRPGRGRESDDDGNATCNIDAVEHKRAVLYDDLVHLAVGKEKRIPGLAHLEGKYEVLRKIKEGGMGAIYLVRHRLLEELRVVKVMRSHLVEDEGLKERFAREARMATRMRHRNIAALFDFDFDDEGNAFMVMEYIDGVTLAAALERGGCPSIGLSLEIARQSLNAIAYLHRGGVVHRDIAPDNIMLARGDFGEPLVKLIDLGIAKVLKGDSGLTATGMFLGKIAYASPEQFLADRDIDSRADLYSFGVVFHELLTTEHPIGSKKPSTIMGFHVRNLPLEFRDPAGRVPEDLRAVVLRALAREPDDRFASARSMSENLGPFEERFPLTLEDFQAWFGAKADDAHPSAVEGASDGAAQEDRSEESTKPGGIPQALRDAQIAREAELVGFMVSASQFDLARQRLDATVSRLGDCERLGAARRAIEAAEERWEEQEAAVESRLRQARKRLASHDLDGARGVLRSALADHPDHPRIAELLEEVEDQLQRQREDEERQRYVQTIAREAERLLAFGAAPRKRSKPDPSKKQ